VGPSCSDERSCRCYVGRMARGPGVIISLYNTCAIISINECEVAGYGSLLLKHTTNISHNPTKSLVCVNKPTIFWKDFNSFFSISHPLSSLKILQLDLVLNSLRYFPLKPWIAFFISDLLETRFLANWWICFLSPNIPQRPPTDHSRFFPLVCFSRTTKDFYVIKEHQAPISASLGVPQIFRAYQQRFSQGSVLSDVTQESSLRKRNWSLDSDPIRPRFWQHHFHFAARANLHQGMEGF